MPIPKPNSSYIDGERTILTLNNSMTFINATTSSTIMPVAKEFMSFIHSDEALNIFSKYCNMMRPFDYELTSETLSAMSTYGKECYRIHNDDKITIQDSYPTTDAAIKNTNLLNPKTWGFTNADGKDNPFVVFKDNASMTAKNYFDSMKNLYTSSYWSAAWTN